MLWQAAIHPFTFLVGKTKSRQFPKFITVGDSHLSTFFFWKLTPEFLYLHSLINGELAQLARALAWHARGHRFDSGILHQLTTF
jgi:hypothetical protein